MALAMWAKSAVGTNLSFIKGVGKALKTWREILQQGVLRKPVPKIKFQKFEVNRASPKDQCLGQPGFQQRSGVQSRIFRSLFSKSASRSLASELRRRSALRISSSSVRNFRHVPIMSLIGVTLGFDASGVVDDSREKMVSEIREMFGHYSVKCDPLEKIPQKLDDLDIDPKPIGNGCEGAVYAAKIKPDLASESSSSDEECDLAVKAVFNYGAESNAHSILRELERETVPCQDVSEIFTREVSRLPPHPNIVDMPGMFVDEVLVTEEGLKRFPAAMPRRLNPERSFGRNKTLYLVMRKRSTQLREYLATNDVSMETRCLLLAQLLEGVSHLGQHGVAHRDLKTDNILVDTPSGGTPRLEICDFGCCLAEESKSLRVPYPSRDLYVGGNRFLTAPEIATAKPGSSSVLDYGKSDLWAVGAIAYEILGGENPFYPRGDDSGKQMMSSDYDEEELPPLPDGVPEPIRKLVKSLLHRDPEKRPTASVAAAVVHMVVQEATSATTGTHTHPHHPHPQGKRYGWVEKQQQGRKPKLVFVSKEKEKFQWVLVQSLTLICQLTLGGQSNGLDMRSVMSFLFLSRLSYADFREALRFF